MKEGRGASVQLKAVLLAICLLLLLCSAGMVYLLLQHRQMSEDMAKLDAQVQGLAQKVWTGAVTLDPKEADKLKKVQRPSGPPGPRGPPGPPRRAKTGNGVLNYQPAHILYDVFSKCALFFHVECTVKTIKCSEKATEMQTTFGSWLLDASLQNDSQHWLAEHFSGRILLEYRNISPSQNKSAKIIDVQGYYQGCGHVVYKGHFYFHLAGTKKLINRYNSLNYLLRNSKTYFKFAVDENGLWVIFALNSEDKMMVAKLNHESFSVTSTIDIAYPTTKAGNAFIACGVVYVSDDKDRKVSYAFDLEKKKPADVNFNVRASNGILAMMSYYPNMKRLIMWDNRSVKMCKVKYQVVI
uniref:Olfactomedin-like domain-containing protein n=1 Tax=Neogobius melanostomus TaxID=47308 RepID=A0A8C6UPI2_9GOBI